MKLTIRQSNSKSKKLDAIFTDADGKTKTVSFGATGYTDYTLSKDPERRARYLNRHRANENWNDYMSPGALSRYILWGDSTDLQTNIRAFKRRFNLT